MAATTTCVTSAAQGDDWDQGVFPPLCATRRSRSETIARPDGELSHGCQKARATEVDFAHRSGLCLRVSYVVETNAGSRAPAPRERERPTDAVRKKGFGSGRDRHHPPRGVRRSRAGRQSESRALDPVGLAACAKTPVQDRRALRPERRARSIPLRAGWSVHGGEMRSQVAPVRR